MMLLIMIGLLHVSHHGSRSALLAPWLFLLSATTARAFSSSKKINHEVLSLTPVQSTSLLVAYWRHLETTRTDHQQTAPLIQDKPASILLDAFLKPEQWQQYEQSPVRSIGWNVLAIRTRLLDDWLLRRGIFDTTTSTTAATVKQETARQIVVLGAGMCARPYRLPLEGGTVVFEVDSDISLLQKKTSVLLNSKDAGIVVQPPTARIIHVESDVRNGKATAVALQNAGLDPTKKTDWIAEGLLEYLDPYQHHQQLFAMAQDLVSSAPKSRMAMQILEPAVAERFQELGVDLPWSVLVDRNVVLEGAMEAGWNVDRVLEDDDFEELFGRNAKLPGFCMAFLEQESA